MNDDIILGERQDWGEPYPFGISAVDQRQHIYVIGKTGSGKTTLLKNMIIQHIEKDHGVGLIDPHGDLTAAQFKELYQPLDTRKHQIETEIPSVQGELDLLKTENLSTDYIMRQGRNLEQTWPTMTHDARRNFLECFVKDITIAKDEIAVNFYALPGFEDMAIKQRTL